MRMPQGQFNAGAVFFKNQDSTARSPCDVFRTVTEPGDVIRDKVHQELSPARPPMRTTGLCIIIRFRPVEKPSFILSPHWQAIPAGRFLASVILHQGTVFEQF